MISRKQFLKQCLSSACAAGLSCAVPSEAEEAPPQNVQNCDPARSKSVEDRADAARLRFALLVKEMESDLPEGQRKHLLHTLGSKCADTFRLSLIDRYKGNLRGFLEEGLRQWMAEAHYDEAAGTIRVVDRSSHCTCPMVKEGVTPPSFCDCTLGWQEEAYSAILGRPVKAELEESILRGNKRCVFVMRVMG